MCQHLQLTPQKRGGVAYGRGEWRGYLRALQLQRGDTAPSAPGSSRSSGSAAARAASPATGRLLLPSPAQLSAPGPPRPRAQRRRSRPPSGAAPRLLGTAPPRGELRETQGRDPAASRCQGTGALGDGQPHPCGESVLRRPPGELTRAPGSPPGAIGRAIARGPPGCLFPLSASFLSSQGQSPSNTHPRGTSLVRVHAGLVLVTVQPCYNDWRVRESGHPPSPSWSGPSGFHCAGEKGNTARGVRESTTAEKL
nr:translation initiation factor IF-2-like [Caretta caretta]